MADERDKSLSESEVEAALKAWSGPAVAEDFVDRVMARIETVEKEQAPRRRRRLAVWAMAAGVAILAAGVLVRMAVTPTLPPGTQLVRFALEVPHAEQVALAGSFNGWGRRIALHAHGHGLWSVRIPLRSGQYSYVFVVNGRRVVPDPHAEGYRPDGFGGRNSLIIVGSPGVSA